MEEKERAALMLTIVLLRRHYGKATTAQRFFALAKFCAAQPVKPLYGTIY
jgi:hypothetical protein